MISRPLILKLSSALVIFGAWEISSRAGINYAFPTFFESMVALWNLTISGQIFAAYAETLKPLVVGVLILV